MASLLVEQFSQLNITFVLSIMNMMSIKRLLSTLKSNFEQTVHFYPIIFL
ncbi:unnamed protein product [Moritella viscosa]|nr:unnamed protein product [Moritella viscosa]SHO20651.1 unnamed protein product [Moritella viscosa]